MYIPSYYSINDRVELVAFMRAHAFAIVVSILDGVPVATHVPLIVVDDGERVLLRGHFARPNPQCEALESGESLVIFGGPHAYVSPFNYASRLSVPTWNYVAVHATGRATVSRDSERVSAMLAELIAENEPDYQAQWDSLPEKYRLGMLGGIVAFEIAVSKLEGKQKLSQTKTRAERERIAESLAASHDEGATRVAELMRTDLSRESER